MALGFRECCNQYSYFTLDTTPSFVSEFETYHIITEQGLNFCAIYTNLPTLNYIPPVYNLLEMTQQTDCAICIESFPCPSQEVILVNEFVSGSVAQGTDCQIVTIPPMFVQCQITNPTTYGASDGKVELVISGGVAPYRFISAGTEVFLSYTQAGENLYTIFDEVPAGGYSVVVQDSYLDFSITTNCILENPSAQLLIDIILTRTSMYGASDGSVEFVLTEGVPPYKIMLNSEEVGLVTKNLTAGIYYFEVSDQISSRIEVVQVEQPDPINYTPGLCLTFQYCGTLFNLNFIKLPIYENLRPRYRCTSPTKIGLKQLDIYWTIDSFTGWTTTVEVSQIDDIQFEVFPGNCDFGDGTFSASGPNTEQPTGSWIGSGMIQGILPIATPGGCPPTAIVKEPIGTYCPGLDVIGPPESLAEVIVEGIGGSGGPYTFFYSSNGVSYTESSIGTFYLKNGTYSVKVKDSDGIESLPTNFTVVTEVNTFRGYQVGFCSIVEPETVGLSGVLDRPINTGEWREIDVTVSHFFDFSTMPTGTTFSGKFQMNVQNSVIAGDYGYGPVDSTEFLFDLKDAFYVKNGVRTDFLSTMLPISNPFSFVGTGDIQGSTGLYTQNYGVWGPSYGTDFCTASTVNPSRTSPSYWYSCSGLSNSSSLIEGDTRGMSYFNSYSLRNGLATFDTDTKLCVKMRIRLRSYMPPYVPLLFNETNATTISPTSYTPVGATLLNRPNQFNNTIGSETYFQVSYQFNSLDLIVSPLTPKCFTLEPSLSSLGRYQVPNTNFTSSRLFFRLDTSTKASGNGSGANEFTNYNNFYSNNNTCVERPSWAL